MREQKKCNSEKRPTHELTSCAKKLACHVENTEALKTEKYESLIVTILSK
jgi:hypothetical protein